MSKDYADVAARVQAEVQTPVEAPEQKSEAKPKPVEREPLGLPKKTEKVEVKEEPVDPPVEDSPKEPDEEKPELTEAQIKRQQLVEEARGKGWVPKKEWVESGKDPDDWVSAKRFMEDNGRIKQWTTMRKDLEKALKQNEELSQIVKRGFERTTEHRMKELMSLRDQAIELGDKEAVRKIDQQAAEEQKMLRQMPQQEEQPTIEPEIQEFVKENREWWGVDPMATQMAVAYYGNLEAADPSALKDNLEKTKKYIKKRFPDLFPADVTAAADAAVAAVDQQQQTRRLSSVSAPTNGGGQVSKGKKWSDLPPETQKVADQLVSKKVITREQYLEQYFGRG